MSIGTILLIILVLLLIGALPSWPYSSGWGPYPAGGLGLVLIIVLILVLMGRVLNKLGNNPTELDDRIASIDVLLEGRER